VPWEEVKRFCSTSGTTGFPELHPLTREDFEQGCVQNVCRAFWAIGLRPSDKVQNLTPFTCLTLICETLGAGVLGDQVGRGNFDHQIMLANIGNVSVLMQLPSLVFNYFERAKELGIDIKKSKIRLILGLGEAWAESYRRKIEADYGVTFSNAWGLSEAGEIAFECQYKGGMHIGSDRHILEVIDPETGEVVEPGQEGEFVITNFFRKAVPKIRFRTSDIGKILPYEPCPCGRTLPKMSMIKGRMPQIINVKGKRFFPVDVEEVVGSIPGLGYEYQIMLEKPEEQERLKVRAEYIPEVENVAALRKQLEEELCQRLNVESEVELVPKGSIKPSLFKAQRVVTEF